MKRADRPQRAAAARYVAYTRKIRAEAELELLIARGMDAWADVLQHSIVSRITAGGPLERADALNHVDEAARAWLVFLQHGLLPRLAALFREAFTEQRTQLPGALTAAGAPDDEFERAFRAELDAINSGDGDPFSGPDAKAYEAEAEALFGEEFNAARRESDHSAYRYEQDHIAQVRDRLVIWPDGAWEEMRPEIEEALAEGESINQVRDRIAHVIGTDSETRRIRADIGDVDRELMRTDLTSNERAELQARRRTLWEQHDGSTDDWEYNARRVARTEVQAAVEGGHDAAAYAAQAETGMELWKRWLATPDDRTRMSHRVADGQIVKLDEKFTVGKAHLDHPADPEGLVAGEIINCVVGSTRVAWPGQSVEGLTRRRYRGTFVHLRTADGHGLTVTPNHPVLTPAGYRPAGVLRPGDHVLATRFPDTPDVGEVPPRVEELFGSVGEARVQKRVVLRGVDFHGDVLEDDEVDVVRADGDLHPVANPPSTGDSREDVLVVPVGRRSGDSSAASAGEAGVGLGVSSSEGQRIGSPAGDVRGLRERPAFGDLHSSHADTVRFARVPDGETQFGKTPDDGRAADSDDLRHLQHARAVGMEPTELVEVDFAFGDHLVYNLTTSDAWYVSNGIAIHNCRCTALYYPWGEVQEEIAGEEGSLGEVRPRGVRLGPDDPTDVQTAIEMEKQAQKEWDAENGGFTAAATASGPHDHDGMVALVPSTADAERLAVAGGEPAAELHVTLAYFPDADRMDPEQLAASVAAAFPGPVRGEVSGRADFTGGDRPCAVYLVQAPGLAAAHDALAPEGGTFDAYVPHITAGYDMGAASLTESGPVTFDRARISVRGQTQDIPLGGSLTAAGRKGFNPAQRRGGDGRWSIDLGGGDTHVNRPARPIREPSATGRGSIPPTAREKAVHPHGLPKLSEPQMIDRQSRLGIETNGETLEQHEIEFVERMNALDQDVEWLAKSTRHQGAGLTPTSDFIWRSNGGMPTELKSTGTDPHGVGRRISDSVKRSSRHGEEYRKRNFIVDLGDADLSPELRTYLEQYNENRRFQAERMKVKPKGAPYTIDRLWVMSQGRLNPIHLQ